MYKLFLLSSIKYIIHISIDMINSTYLIHNANKKFLLQCFDELVLPRIKRQFVDIIKIYFHLKRNIH